jgi:hypothetical protein
MSGLSHTPGKRAWGYTHRGFESRPFRQLVSMHAGFKVFQNLPTFEPRYKQADLLQENRQSPVLYRAFVFFGPGIGDRSRCYTRLPQKQVPVPTRVKHIPAPFCAACCPASKPPPLSGLHDLRVDRLRLDDDGIAQWRRSTPYSAISLCTGKIYSRRSIPDTHLPTIQGRPPC